MRRFARSLLSIAGFVLAAGGARADDDLTLANLNLLHGVGCNPDQCRLPDRVDLLFAWIESASCPDAVTLQEVIDPPSGISARALIEARLPAACGGQYDGHTAYSGVLGVDEEMVLSRYPIAGSEVRELHGAVPVFTRHALWVRLQHPAGPIDVVTTHLASGSDMATSPCDVDSNGDTIVDIPCPAECAAASASTIRECQAVQLVAFTEEKHDVGTPALVTGDLNAEPGSFEVGWLLAAGYTDTYLAAGNPECAPATGVGCTSGRASSSVAELESTAANVDHRIDYAFLVPGSACTTSLDSPGDADADGTATRIFADAPNPFAACGASPSPVCWPSDHEGAEVDVGLACGVPVPSASPSGLALLGLSLVGVVFSAALRRRRED
jgi:endonuclease/exonuclease/phosphatase family metal-dependent hydrolase